MTAATLVAQNYPLLLHYARRLAPWAAEDIAQDAAELALRWDNYKPGKPVRNWLYWCVMSAREKYGRYDAKPKKARAALSAANDNTVQPVQEHAAELALLAERITNLPPRQREVMTGLMAGNHTGEISRQLGVSCQAVGTTARKARAKLAA